MFAVVGYTLSLWLILRTPDISVDTVGRRHGVWRGILEGLRFAIGNRQLLHLRRCSPQPDGTGTRHRGRVWCFRR